MKTKRAVVVGLDYHANFLAELMTRHSSGWSMRAFDTSRLGTMRALWALRKSQALIVFGGPAPNTALTLAARRRGIPVFVIWAGSDVIKAQSDPFELEMIKQEDFINLAVAPWLVDELRSLGIEARYLPVAGMEPGAGVRPFPREFRVLTYLPEPRRAFYGADLVYRVASELHDVAFDVVGAGAPAQAAPPNVTFHGHVADMNRRLDDTVVLLRQPEHDGLSMLVLEALARGRHVVWNYAFPHVRTAGTPQDVKRELLELKEAHAAGTLEPNGAGRSYVLDRFSRADVARNLEAALNEAVAARSTAAPKISGRVAISGLGLFCGEIVQNSKSVVPEWEARVLRTNSRLEVLTSIVTLFGCDVWYSIGSPITDRWVHLVARLLKKPRVIHWVGSDIAGVANQPSLRALLSAPNIVHLAEVEWTAKELRGLGFDARIAPLPPRHADGEAKALPQQFTVMLYVPRTRADFYGRRSFSDLMEGLRDKPIKYVVVGGGSIDAPPGIDVENLGWRNDLRDVYERVSVLIRYTPRDGLSLMVLEALSYGRHVLWTQEFPYTRRIGAYSDMEREIRNLYAEHEAGTLTPQTAAAALVRSRYAPETCTRSIADAWREAAQAQPPGGTLAMEAP